jgi:anti-sigma factor RsiW
MNCQEASVLLHAFIDDELDAGHAHEIEAHVSGCARCAAELRGLRDMHRRLSSAQLRYQAPPALHRRIENSLRVPRPAPPAPNRRSLLQGFVMGGMLSAAAAASLVLFVDRDAQDQRLLGDVVSAHLRSLQANHLTDVETSDQHVVRPWFNGRLDLAPPVVDLTAQGFTLIGGRLDYIDARPVAAIVYKRRAHVINLFVSQALPSAPLTSSQASVSGYNIRRWTDGDLDLLAVSDLNSEELSEFVEKFQAGLRAGNTL